MQLRSSILSHLRDMDAHIRHAIVRFAILAGHAGAAYLACDVNTLHGDGTSEDFTGLVGLSDVMIMYNRSMFKVLDLATVNTTIYAIGLFCLFFNCRVLAADTYSQLIEAIDDHPTLIARYIPTSLIETHGFRHAHIIGIAWQHVRQLHNGIHNAITTEAMWVLLHQPLPSPPPSPSPDILNLLVTAAANNSM